MNNQFDLHGLTHERLVDVVREGVGASSVGPRTELSPSLYRRDPDVPALRIQTYPRRRSRRVESTRGREGAVPLENPAYQDFLVDDVAPGTHDLESA